MKEQIVEILKEAGFVEAGANQFFHPSLGRLHLADNVTPSGLVQKLMSLGAQHQAKAMRDALMIEKATECYIFEAVA